MTTQFSSNTFENDYILATLEHFITEMHTDKPRAQILDKYACELTAFMNGQIIQAVKNKVSNVELRGDAPARSPA